jgi:predicted phage gp36 major capsid-like protein
MREAQKMMNDPAFQAQMKKMTDSEGFKEHMDASSDMMKDPEKVKEIEAKMQERLVEGNVMLEKFKEQERKHLENEKKAGEEDGDKKQAAAKEDEDTAAEADEMPDVPSLNLN